VGTNVSTSQLAAQGTTRLGVSKRPVRRLLFDSRVSRAARIGRGARVEYLSLGSEILIV
jgi:hypothetical protein